jgi:hypothetical protein
MTNRVSNRECAFSSYSDGREERFFYVDPTELEVTELDYYRVPGMISARGSCFPIDRLWESNASDGGGQWTVSEERKHDAVDDTGVGSHVVLYYDSLFLESAFWAARSETSS